MADSTNKGQNNIVASGVASGIGPAVAGIFNNLWSAKERRRQQEYNTKQYGQEVKDNRENATIAYNRSIDYKAQMEAYKQAGINPYMVASNGVQPSMASSAHANPTQQAKFDFSQVGKSVGDIPIQIMQMKMMQSQIDKTNAETNKLNQDTSAGQFTLDLDRQFRPLERSLGLQQTNQLISNAKATESNINALTDLSKQHNLGQQIQNAISRINLMYQDKQKQLEQETMQQNNRESQSRISKNAQDIEKLKADTDKIRAEIPNIIQAFETGRINQAEMNARIDKLFEETRTIDDMRKPQIENIKRSNWNKFSIWDNIWKHGKDSNSNPHR